MNGGGFMNGSPWWVKFIGTVGVPSAIAIYLVWSLSNDIPRQIEASMTIHDQSTERRMVEQAQRGRVLLSVMQQICINTATTSQDRRACVPPPGQ